MQLDAEEDENIFYKPPVEPTARQTSDERDSSETTGAINVVGEDDD